MNEMYKEYDRGRVDNISDPAVRQQHPISTIYGMSESGDQMVPSGRSGVQISEVIDTSEQGTQYDNVQSAISNTEQAADASDIHVQVQDVEVTTQDEQETTEPDRAKAYEKLGFEPSVTEFMNEVIEDVAKTVEKTDGDVVPESSEKTDSEGTEKSETESQEAVAAAEGDAALAAESSQEPQGTSATEDALKM
jgi:hypothetical protein